MMGSGIRNSTGTRIRVTLLAAFLVYSVVWGIVVLLRYYSYNAGVFDLGLASDYLYRLGHSGLPYLISIPTHLPLNKMIALVLAVPYYLAPYPQWLLVFQSVWIGAGIFPLYRIIKHYTDHEVAALLLSLSYLLYYPLAGVNWFDFHFMAVFPTAFLFSVMYNMEGRRKLAVFFGIIAAISDYLVPLILLFYAVYCILERWHRERRLKIDTYSAVMIGTSLAIIVIVNVFFGFGYSTQYLHLSGATYSTAYVASASQKATYFYAMLLPVLFLSILGGEFLAVGIPFFALGFVNTYEPYVTTMYFQYPALIAPVIFISAAIGLSRIAKIVPARKKAALKAASTAFLILNVVLFSFFTPIGNMYTGNIYSPHYGKYVSGNSYQYTGLQDITVTQYDHYLSEISGHIPMGASVLIQNNMPQLTSGHDWELPDFMPAGFNPQYIVVDPYSMFYDQYSAAYHPNNATMAVMANRFFQSGNYTLAYSMAGVILMQRDAAYKGTIDFAQLSLNSTLSAANPSDFPVSVNNTSLTFFEGRLPFVIPGYYKLSITVSGQPLNLTQSPVVVIRGQNNGSEVQTSVFEVGQTAMDVRGFSGESGIFVLLPSGLEGTALNLHLVSYEPGHGSIPP